MRRFIAIAVLLAAATGAAAADATNLFFLHHSTGRYMREGADARTMLAEMNQRDGTSFELWDHDYNHIGLRNPDGTFVGTYDIPDDNTDPDGLHVLWTTDNAARTAILGNHEVIAFKSCYPASNITSDAMLEERKGWYLEIRDVFDQHPDKIFLVMSQPPRHRLATNLAEADRARAFANWLGSEEFLTGHPNVKYFDFFDLLAHPDDGSDARNMLRWDYEISHTGDDSHPNALANETIGPQFVAALVAAAAGSTAPAETLSVGGMKNRFR